jgi:thiamine biosynthesis lipoprotein
MEAVASIRRARPLLGTFVEIAAARASAPALEAAVEAAFSAVAMVHWLMSFHEPESDVSRLNRHAAAGAVRVHDWTYQVLEAALDLHQRSGGTFDIAVAPALQALGLLPGTSRSSGTAGWRCTTTPINLLPQNHVRFAHPGVTIDLGGIAKGFAVDRAIEALQRHGIAEGLVNAGGDVAAFGPQSHAIEIRDPRHPERPLCGVALRDAALASSAGRFDPAHSRDASPAAVIDPLTGMAVRAIIGASVWAPRCIIADALTKVVMNTGEGTAAILAHYGASAMFVSAQGDVHVTADRKNEVRFAA